MALIAGIIAFIIIAGAAAGELPLARGAPELPLAENSRSIAGRLQQVPERPLAGIQQAEADVSGQPAVAVGRENESTDAGDQARNSIGIAQPAVKPWR